MLLSIGHEVMIFDNWPRDILILECGDVLGRRRVDEAHVRLLVFVTVVNECINLLEARVLVRAREIVTHQNHHVTLCHLDVCDQVSIILQFSAPPVKVEAHVRGIINDGILEIVLVGESRWRRVVPEEDLGQNLL